MHDQQNPKQNKSSLQPFRVEPHIFLFENALQPSTVPVGETWYCVMGVGEQSDGAVRGDDRC